MKLLIPFLFFIGISSNGYSQNILKGKIVANGDNFENITIINLTSTIKVNADAEGYFLISAKANDILEITGNECKKLQIILKEEDFAKKLYFIRFSCANASKIIQLNEVEIKSNQDINAVSLGILSKPAKKYTPAERRLKTAGDFKPIHLLGLLGGQFQLDPVLNAINGKTKRLKKELKVERNEKMLQKLDSFFDQDFYTNTLQIPLDYKVGFQMYAIEDARVLKSIKENNKTFTSFLLSEIAEKYKSIVFPKQ